MNYNEMMKAAKEVAELDKGRTEGSWAYDGEETVASADWDGQGYSLFPVDNENHCSGFIADFDLNEEDAAFCAKAPEMASLIAAMAEELKKREWQKNSGTAPDIGDSWVLVTDVKSRVENYCVGCVESFDWEWELSGGVSHYMVITPPTETTEAQDEN